MISTETIITACTVCTLGGSAAGWFGRHFTVKSKNGHLTKEDHALICAPIKQALEEGNRRFVGMDQKLDMILNALISRKTRN